MEYFSEYKVKEAIEEKLKRSITDFEWRVITTIILYEIKGTFHIIDKDLDIDMERIKKLLKFIRGK